MVGRSKEAGGLRASEDASGRHLLLLLHGHPPTAANNGDQLSPGRSLLDGTAMAARASMQGADASVSGAAHQGPALPPRM